MRSDRPLPYADPTGNAATALADAATAERVHADIDALWEIDTAPGLESRRDTRPLTNGHCVAAIIATRIASSTPAEHLLANAHTADTEATWEPDNTPAPPTSWWDSTPRTSEF